ncbi:MAG: preprotein translocase subunit SecY [Lachnospiraceae bacterium]|nr:preprotein translocase subunit SecY [Lachnospiraceae bacterium]MBR1844722.1 preprotein translocase subunit SecY [Lachnospiraceae bacterium]
MWQMILNAFRVKDIRNKLLFTLFMLLVIRIGSNIPVPGANTDFFKNLFDNLQAQNAVGWLSNMTGGSFEEMSVFALSITPYITSSIIMELLTIAIPALEEIQKEGTDGRRKIAEYTRYVTVALALLESSAMAIGFSGSGFFKGYETGGAPVSTIIVAILAMTAGSAFLMWAGERITESGVGNGISIVLLFNILSSLPKDFGTIYERFLRGKNMAFMITYALIILGIVVLIIALAVILQDARRDIPVQYASRIAGRNSMSNGASVIPLKVNTAGVIPVIFASSIMSLPLIILQFLDIRNTVFNVFASVLNSGSWFRQEYPIYSVGCIIYIFLVIFFAYFYTSITFNPNEVAANIKKGGGFIPGIRAGKETADYLTRILNYIIFIGAVGLCIVALIPIIISGVFNISRISFAGTSLLIIVGVILETLAQIKSQLIVRNYQGFLSE